MLYTLKNCRNGGPAPYETTVDITEENNVITFRFTATHSSFYCPHQGYNKIHSEGPIPRGASITRLRSVPTAISCWLK